MKRREEQAAVNLDGFDFIGDVPVTIEVELDRRTISFRELLDLRVGRVVALTRPTGENIDLYAGGVPIGNGEVLVVESRLAVRVADLREAVEDEWEAPAPEASAAEAVSL
ncbi:MAG TPA: FliM/FliN family flagellar motor switch protein [Bryobacteraceae bacterium]